MRLELMIYFGFVPKKRGAVITFFREVTMKEESLFWSSRTTLWIILFLFITTIVSALQTKPPERWVPDYENRDAWQQPYKIMDAIGIRPRMTIADIGAGKGYFSFKLAERVGLEGLVYASDIKESQLNAIKDRMQKEGIKNIVPILGEEDDPGLPNGQIDIILMVHVFHIVIQEQNPLALLSKLHQSLKPDGLLVLVQWNGIKMGYPNVYAYSEESVLNIIKDSNFELVRTETFLPRETIFILCPLSQ